MTSSCRMILLSFEKSYWRELDYEQHKEALPIGVIIGVTQRATLLSSVTVLWNAPFSDGYDKGLLFDSWRRT